MRRTKGRHSWGKKLSYDLQIVKLLNLSRNNEQLGHECPFEVLLFSDLVHVLCYAMSIRRRLRGLEFVVRDQFEGRDKRVSRF
jgi:hypothetical protein